MAEAWLTIIGLGEDGLNGLNGASRAVLDRAEIVFGGPRHLDLAEVGARALRLLGRLEPGVPKSVIEGGEWAGVEVISKSGAFGAADLWHKLLKQNGLI